MSYGWTKEWREWDDKRGWTVTMTCNSEEEGVIDASGATHEEAMEVLRKKIEGLESSLINHYA